MLSRSQPSKSKVAARSSWIALGAAALSLLACSHPCPKSERCVSLHCSVEIQSASVEWSLDQMSIASDVVVSESSKPAAGRCHIAIPTVDPEPSKTPSRCDMPVRLVCAPGPEEQLPDAATRSLLYEVSFRLPDPFYLGPGGSVRALTSTSIEWHQSSADGQTLTDGSAPSDDSVPTLMDALPPGEDLRAVDATGAGQPCRIWRAGAASMTIEEATGTSASDFRRGLRIDLDTTGWSAEPADANCTGQTWMRGSVRLLQTSAHRVVEEGVCPWSYCE
jgi:hypothetical protein